MQSKTLKTTRASEGRLRAMVRQVIRAAYEPGDEVFGDPQAALFASAEQLEPAAYDRFLELLLGEGDAAGEEGLPC